ncbi:MAG: Mrp/NBP35 family ATP-binding protein [Candidatus Marinimicrobia bacterium]|nr:Mrp/NBP35 family ATP-binding protein [Candidatus Neomarinimicrobiota bacterium]
MTQEKVNELLKSINYPGFSRDIVSFGIVKGIQVSENQIAVNLAIATQNQEHISSIKNEIEQVLSSETGIADIKVSFDVQPVKQAPSNGAPVGQQPIPGVKHVIAVGSGKGGVGKSTVAINLAAELSKNYKVGVLDLDIYGPSLPMVIGSNEQPKITAEQKLIPVEKFGMKFMSFGFINSDNAATIWRGPMVAKLTTQFFDDVIWGELDYLILDLPPGTGDIQLTLVQRLALTGAIIVTTPQDLALIDVKKGADMFKKVNTPVLGVVENMSHYLCPHCNKESEIFPGSGGASESDRLDVPLLAQIYMTPEIAASTDSGEPYVFKYTDSPITKMYASMSEKIAELVSE